MCFTSCQGENVAAVERLSDGKFACVCQFHLREIRQKEIRVRRFNSIAPVRRIQWLKARYASEVCEYCGQVKLGLHKSCLARQILKRPGGVIYTRGINYVVPSR